LLALAQRHDSAYVYDPTVVRAAARALCGLGAVDHVLYAMKANPHPSILQLLAAEGLSFECVSRGEIEHLRAHVPGIAGERILFTPNFAPRDEYAWALAAGVRLTIDNVYILREWGESFRGRSVFLRVDPGIGRGHHHHVRTAGTQAKFGVPLDEIDTALALAHQHGVQITGLHAHSGSGIFDAANWSEVARVLLQLAQRLPQLRVIDVGGGLGVPEGHGQPGLDLQRLDTVLKAARQARPDVALWIEPGRYLVAAAGALIARVTQLKSKDEVRYVGIATGMNSLIRPALYGAWHEIVNLTRLEDPSTELAHVVGPICESADFLGHDRLLPPTREGDVLLIANAGAYGHSMSSHYNLRAPATEIMLG
jgi:diaminopimelate decarboxylase/aspartate kinase